MTKDLAAIGAKGKLLGGMNDSHTLEVEGAEVHPARGIRRVIASLVDHVVGKLHGQGVIEDNMSRPENTNVLIEQSEQGVQARGNFPTLDGLLLDF